MVECPSTARAESRVDVKPYSCLSCRQRKVKCDRRIPCSHCLKAEKQCSFIAPVRGKRSRTKPPRESLHARLKRYEDLLRSYGANIDSLGADDGHNELQDFSPNETVIGEDVESQGQIDPYGLEKTNSRLVVREGSSRYLDGALWSNLGNEFEHPENGSPGESTDDSDLDETDMLFDTDTGSRTLQLASLHPPEEAISVMKEIFIDRVDPLVKVLHLPTLWKMLEESMQDPERIPKSSQSLIFAFYLVTIVSLKEDECRDMLGLQRSVALPYYRKATQKALKEAGLLSTVSPTTLQAFAVFMTCIGKIIKEDTLYALSGIAIRLARKMGLHRDGASLNLPPFESEMRRRLWWHLVAVDYRTSDVTGTRPSLDLASCDTNLPLNIDDHDLSPEMTSLPTEQSGILPTTCSIVRSEMSEMLRKLSVEYGRGLRWGVLSSPEVSLAKKEAIINQVEDHFERKYLRHFDPCNDLHTFFSVMFRSGICKMRLFAYRPTQGLADNDVQAPDAATRDSMLANTTKLLEYITYLQEDHPTLGKFAWQSGSSHLWISMLHVLVELRRRKTGPEIDKAWQLIGTVYSHYPQVFQESSGSAYTNLGRWTLDVWDKCVAASTSDGLGGPVVPEYILALRRRQPGSGTKSPMTDTTALDGVAAATGGFFPARHAPAYDAPELSSQENHLMLELPPLDGCDFADFESSLMRDNEWEQWEQLFGAQTRF